MHKRLLSFALLFATAAWGSEDISTWMTPAQLHRAESLTSLFENDTPQIKYGYCSNIGDGRGLTCGRAGFVTYNDEVYDVVRTYCDRKPNNPLAPFLPALKKLAEDESEETTGLKGMPKAWHAAAKDPAFCAIQDEAAHRLYLQPVIVWTGKLGVKTALAKAAIYDTMIQHGDDGDPDCLSAIISRTNKIAGGTPATGIDEKVWLNDFIKTRRADLAHSYDPASREEWAKAVIRCDALSTLAARRNYNLDGPIVFDDDNWTATIP